MKKQFCLLLFILLGISCSDDIPGYDHLEGDTKPKHLVSRIVKTNLNYWDDNEVWIFEYDDQNRITLLVKQYGLDQTKCRSDTSYFQHEKNQIIQTYKMTEDGRYHRLFVYSLDSIGRVKMLERITRWNNGENITESGDVEYFHYDDEGYLVFIDALEYDGENKTARWEGGDIQRISYNGGSPSFVWKYAEHKNNPYANIDFNHFLDNNELCRHFIDYDNRCLKYFGIFGKRTKHLKIRETGILYEYTIDKQGLVTKIKEAEEDDEAGDYLYIYEISYINAK